MEQQKLSPFLRFVRLVLLTNVGIFAACAVVVWLGGWRTPYDYGSALILAGTAIVCVGASGILAGWALPPTADYQYDQTPSSDLVRQLIRRVLASRRRYYGFTVRMAITGAVPILVGTSIQTYLS